MGLGGNPYGPAGKLIMFSILWQRLDSPTEVLTQELERLNL